MESTGIRTVKTEKGPKAIGPYSVGKVFNGVAFISGQIPLNPETGQIVEGGIEEQTRQVMKNLSTVVEDAGSSMDKVLKCTIYLVDMDDFAKVNEVYGSYFKADPPARVTVAVKDLPRKSRVQIDAIAVVDCSQKKATKEEVLAA